MTGHFPSIKNSKSIGFESELENSLFLTLEFDNDVKQYLEQPQFKIVLDGKEKTYSADCFIQRVENSKYLDTIVEVKYVSEIEKDKEYLEKKFRAAKEACHDLGIDFLVYTDLTYSKTYRSNLDFLYRYKTQTRETRFDEIITKKLGNQTISADDLAKSIATNPSEYIIIANAIWGLVANYELITDLNTVELTMTSTIRINNERR